MTTNHMQEMLAKLDRANVLSELNPQDKGKYYALDCPDCGEKKAYIYKNGAGYERGRC